MPTIFPEGSWRKFQLWCFQKNRNCECKCTIRLPAAVRLCLMNLDAFDFRELYRYNFLPVYRWDGVSLRKDTIFAPSSLRALIKAEY